MGSRSGFDSQGALDELQNIVDVGSGAVSVATRQATAQYNLGLNGTASAMTPGTTKASSVLVVGAGRNLDFLRVDDLESGVSGTAGTVTIFPSTAASGKLTLTVSAASGDTTTNINVAAQAGARTLTVPDPGASASFVMTAGAQTVGGAKTFSSSPILGTGTQLDLASTTATLSSNAATITEYAAVITTESLTTASGASQALVITKAGVSAGDFAMVTAAGGTNTRKAYLYEAVCTSNTVTVTVINNHASSLNGTLIFNLVVHKA